MDDPTLYVIGIMEEVLRDLRVEVERFMLQDMKSSIITLPQTLKDADGIILASTVEWHGIGGYMQQFLDACWLYGDKDKIASLYMCPVVMSTTYGEREGKLDLAQAWEILGGKPCSGLCGYIEDMAVLEENDEYHALIEKKAEDLYRTINKKVPSLPASNQAVKQKVSITKNTDLSQKEAEQLSQYASDDGYVQRSKEDLKELASLFRGKMREPGEDRDDLVQLLQKGFRPIENWQGVVRIRLDKLEPITMEIAGINISISDDARTSADIELTTGQDVLQDIVDGRITFQRAFMSGRMTMRGGEMRQIGKLDTLFEFGR